MIRSLPDTTVLDDESPRMLLVEGPAEELQTAIKSLPNWVMTEERELTLPDPRPRLGTTKKMSAAMSRITNRTSSNFFHRERVSEG
jgi:hypothetical protein